MDPREFYRNVQEHESLEWLGAREGKTPVEDEVIVKYSTTGARFAILISAIKENPWEELFDVLVGKRQPNIMAHISRVVGYYAFFHNMNRSKQQEVIDRRRGNYTLPESKASEVPSAHRTCVPELRKAVCTASL